MTGDDQTDRENNGMRNQISVVIPHISDGGQTIRLSANQCQIVRDLNGWIEDVVANDGEHAADEHFICKCVQALHHFKQGD